MIGRTISHYKILEKLGEGGMGVVYKAEDTKLGRTVALKFLPAEMTKSPEAKERFVREAQAASALDHPNICTIYEIDEAEGQTFLSMACVEGESLRKKIEAGPLPLDEAIGIAIQVAEGLQEAHEKGIVHRDIKPENVMVTPKGQTKVMDFGLARSAGKTTLTKEGTTLGTVAYMSPEQARGEHVDHRADIWSLGVVLYEMVTGRPPFRGDFEQAVIYSILNESAPPVTGIRTGVPVELEGAIHRCLEKDSAERYQTAGDLAAKLRLVQRTLGVLVAAVRPAPPREKRRRWPWIAAGAGLAAVAAVTLFVKGGAWIERPPAALAAENTLAVMYFDNLTDPSDPDKLGEIATNLLITDLSESRFIQVVSSQRLYDILKLLGREGVKRIDRDVASEIAEKANAKWMLLGSILWADPDLLITSQLVEVGSGRVRASQRVSCKADEGIFALVDRLTVEVKNDLVLPAAARSEPDLPVANATTDSPEAYRAYLEGMDYLHKLYLPEAERKLREAVERDSTFAMAYLWLWFTEDAQDGPADSVREALAKAVEYSEKAGRKERDFIASLAALAHGDWRRGIERLETFVRDYPDEKNAFFFLGHCHRRYAGDFAEATRCVERSIELDPLYKQAYNLAAYCQERMGDHEAAMRAIDRYIELAPNEANPYDTQGDLYASAGQMDRAIESYRRALERKPDFYVSLRKLGDLYLIEQLHAEAESAYGLLASSPRPQVRANGRKHLASLPMHRGELDQALRALDEAIAADAKDGAIGPETAEKHEMKALIFEEKRDPASALVEVGRGETIRREMAPDEQAAWRWRRVRLLAKAGEFSRAGDLLGAMRADFEEKTPSLMGYFYWGSGALALAEGDAKTAAELFEKGFGVPAGSGPPLDARCAQAEAYLGSGEPEKAATELEKALTRYEDWGAGWPVEWARGHYLLGIAYEESGRSGEAVDQYEKFLAIWKDADPDLQEPDDARARMARLRS